jgi:peptide deformylase
MAIKPLVILPDPQLKRVSEPVTAVTPDIRVLAADMLDTMYDAPGIGRAAIQIGVAKRVVTIDLAKQDEERSPIVFLNPEITWESEEMALYEEGCLSIPEYYEEVERPAVVKVRYLDLDGKTREIEADGLMATCIQHEIDHLDGVLFIDHLSKLKRDRCVKKFAKQAKERERGA